MEFFGKIDRQGGSGKIRSQYPAWYFDQQIEELQESVATKQRFLKQGVIPLDQLPNYESELKRDEQRLKDIVESRPKLSDIDKDKLDKARKSLGKRIQDSMFTHTDMDKGFASANEEAHRMVDPVIEVKDGDKELLDSMGITPTKGKISRNQATKVWQIISKALDEETNVEILRKAGTTGRRYIAK